MTRTPVAATAALLAAFFLPGCGSEQPAPGAAVTLPPIAPMTSRQAAPPAAPADAAAAEAMAPPAGGLSIADVWAKRASLAGRPVSVRGKVVKFNGGIMDRNWLHLQDGSGSAADGTNDLTVTTAAEVKVGDVVTVSGVLATGRDFGAGYAYAVILERATVQPAD